jgi:hypothetical protein
MDQSKEPRQAIRYPLAVQRVCAFSVINMKDLVWKDHTAQLKDISITGVGIAAKDWIEPGFVWFQHRVTGHRGGMLLWCRSVGQQYRSGIQFAKLTRSEEEFLHEQVALIRDHQPLIAPEAIIATIRESISRDPHRIPI